MEVVEESATCVKRDKITARNIVYVLYCICRKPVLVEAIRAHSEVWVESAKAMVSDLSETPCLRQAELMLTHLQILGGDVDV
jgi:hypothetical protein